MSLREDTIEFLPVIENASNVTGNRDIARRCALMKHSLQYHIPLKKVEDDLTG